MTDDEFDAYEEVRKARIKFNDRKISIDTFGTILRGIWLSRRELAELENNPSLHR